MITPINATKTVISPVNKEIGSFYLLTEAGDFLTQEDGSLIMLDLVSYAITGINQQKQNREATFITTDEGYFLVTDEGYFLITSPEKTPINQPKS